MTQCFMTSQCQCMTPGRLIRAAKLRFAHYIIKILYTLHNLVKKKVNRCCFEAHSKAREAVTFSHSRAYGSCLACQRFIQNLTSDRFLFLMFMPTE